MRLRAALTRRWLPLAIVLVLMMVFAFSDHLSAADVRVIDIALPPWLEDAASTFRSTGRFVWPLLYVVTIGAVVLVARRFRLVIALPLALVALGAQVVDSYPQLQLFSSHMAAPAPTWKTPLVSPFWDRAAAAGYTRVRAIPVINPGHGWQALDYFAATHHMQIDSAYLGRTDGEALAELRQRDSAALASGTLEPETLYVLDAQSAAEAARHLAPGDLLAVIDKLVVFAKGGAPLVDGLGIPPQSALDH